MPQCEAWLRDDLCAETPNGRQDLPKDYRDRNSSDRLHLRMLS